jgi:hypothetical protein
MNPIIKLFQNSIHNISIRAGQDLQSPSPEAQKLAADILQDVKQLFLQIENLIDNSGVQK